MESPIIALWKAPAPPRRAGGGLGRSHRRITTTGATLKANALKNLDDGVILRSQANLVASLAAPWSEAAREAARIILSRIAAEEEAGRRANSRSSWRRQRQLLRKAETKFGAILRERARAVCWCSSRGE